MIKIIESRPKVYRSLSLNKALYNLITHQSDKNRRRTAFLYDQAKIIESELQKYGLDFLNKSRWIIFNKIDLLDKKELKMFIKKLNIKYPVYLISSVTGEGINKLCGDIFKYLS